MAPPRAAAPRPSIRQAYRQRSPDLLLAVTGMNRLSRLEGPGRTQVDPDREGGTRLRPQGVLRGRAHPSRGVGKLRRALSFVASIGLVIALSPVAHASAGPRFTAGARGAGDPYFPLDGNGGYEVDHYGLDITYNPATDVLMGVATIEATSTKNLSRFDFDFDGLTVRSIRIDGQRATWERHHG